MDIRRAHLRNRVARGCWGSSLCRRACRDPGARGGPARSHLQVSDAPPGVLLRALTHWPKGCVLGFSWLFVFTFHLQPKQQDRRITWWTRVTQPRHQLVFKRWEKLACFPHSCWPCPPPRAMHANGKTAQVRRPSSFLCSWSGVNKWGVGLTLERTRWSQVTVRGTVGSLSRCLKGH